MLYDSSKSNLYAAIVAIVAVYLIIITYVVYYYSNDFYVVFCKKKCTNSEPITADNQKKDIPNKKKN